MRLLGRLLSSSLSCSASLRSSFSMSYNSSEIIEESVGSARVVTLNRPKALNALNLNIVHELYPLLKKWDKSDDVSMVLVKGAGEKAFCAGGDVLAVTKAAKEGAETGGSSRVLDDFLRDGYQLMHLIGTLRKPYVALINGITMGAGCGLAVNGRFRVASEKTLLSMPETALGFFPDTGASHFLSRLKNNLGVFLALTGHALQGADTFHAGLATHYVPSSRVQELEEHLLSLSSHNEHSVDAAIRSFQPKEVLEFSLSQHLPAIRKAFSASTVEEIFSNLRLMDSEWSRKQVKLLQKMSPTSLKVTLEQMERGTRTSYGKIFTMEYRLSQRFMAAHDIHEGCRAILIDKDRNPKWEPATLAEVSDEVVESYFQPLPHPQELIIHEDTLFSKL